MARRGLVLSAPSSNAGKTLVTLGVLRALKNRGIAVSGAKSGPDYIDPQFHQAASGHPSVTLDAWAMDNGSLRARASDQPGTVLLIEGAMGVLDGAFPDGRGSTADLAADLGLPVILILDAARAAQSLVLPVAGLRQLHPHLHIAGVILNRIGSARHEAMIHRSMTALDVPILGSLPRSPDLTLPERHLGLVQAMENPDLEIFLERAASLCATHLDLDAIMEATEPLQPDGPLKRLLPLGQKIAVAQDIAFSFAYPHHLQDWRAQGAEILPFSPLENEPVPPDADAVFLPGGYPELHAARLSSATRFMQSLRESATDKLIYGECGGFMTLGETLEDATGQTHPMAGLLPVETSFAKRKLSLGYRTLTQGGPLPWQGRLSAHEFHYATITKQAGSTALFEASDAAGTALPPMGLQVGRTCGSFAHLISHAP